MVTEQDLIGGDAGRLTAAQIAALDDLIDAAITVMIWINDWPGIDDADKAALDETISRAVREFKPLGACKGRD